MIHGMLGGSWGWDNYREFFEAKGYNCICPNLRYHDVSTPEAPHPSLGHTSLLDYAADLEAEIHKLPDQPILIGHSMGGLLAQMLASRGLAKAVVLLTPAAPAGVFAMAPSVVRCFLRCMTTWGFWRQPMFPTFEETVYAVLHLMPLEEQKEIYRRLVPESGRAVFEIGLWFLDKARAARVNAKDVTSSVLVIAGKHDRITPASVVRRIAAKYERVATYREYADRAHWVLSGPGWEGIAEDILKWLEIKTKLI